MPWVAAAIVVAGVVSAVASDKAAKKAAKQQEAAANRASDELRRGQEKADAAMAPFMTGGSNRAVLKRDPTSQAPNPSAPAQKQQVQQTNRFAAPIEPATQPVAAQQPVAANTAKFRGGML